MRNSQQGFSLLEVMVAGAIMSSGLAGLAALLLTAVSGTAQSGYRTAASLLADGMAVQMEISPSSLQTFLQTPPLIVAHCDAGNTCSGQQFSAASLKSWQIQVADLLPAGVGVVCRDSSPFDGSSDSPACNGAGPVVIKVFWQPGVRLGSFAARVVKVAG